MADMEAIYAWTETEPNGNEGIIYSFIPAIGTGGNLQHRRRDIVEKHFRSIAEGYAQSTGPKVRLVRFVRGETLEEL